MKLHFIAFIAPTIGVFDPKGTSLVNAEHREPIVIDVKSRIYVTSKVADKSKDVYEMGKKGIADTYDHAKEIDKNAYKNVKDAGSSTISQAKQSYEDDKDNVADTYEGAKDAGANIINKGKQSYDQGKDNVVDTYENVKDSGVRLE